MPVKFGWDKLKRFTASPGAIGSTTPAAGTFTTLQTTGNETVGLTTAGANLTVNATRTSIFTHDAANYNEDGATWTITDAGPLVHVTGNTTAVTGTGTEAIVAGTTYRVTITGTGGGATASYTLGGVTGTTIAASGAIAIEDFITASTTGALIITPSNTCTVSITSITIKKLTDATGDLTVDGDLRVRSQIVVSDPADVFLARSGYPTTGFSMINGLLGYTYLGSPKIYFHDGSLMYVVGGIVLGSNGLSNYGWLYGDESNAIALRNSTNQQILRVYNTAGAYPTATNYERLTLTGVQGASVNITAETAGTGGDNLDIILTPAGTGGVTFPFKEEIEPATDNIAAAQCYGSVINNYGQSGDATLTLPAAARGMNFTVILGTTVANYFRLDPNASDSVYLDGVTTGDGKYVGVASAAAGNAIQFVAFQTGASAYDWLATTVSGAWVQEA